MIKIEGLEKITSLVKELNDFKNKGLQSTIRASLKKVADTAAKQARKNARAMIKAVGNKASVKGLQRSIVVRRYSKKIKISSRYKVLISKKSF